MNQPTRRKFLFVSSGAAAGSLLVPGLEEVQSSSGHPPQNEPLFSGSGLITGQLKPLRNDSIPGFLSAQQIAPHHTSHYGGALKGYVSADATLEGAAKAGQAIDGPSFGALKRIINSKGNSVILHEMYFDGLAINKNDPAAEVRAAIEARFGSIEKWATDFVASAKDAAGWAMLVKHPVNGKLYNVVSDEHAMGILWMATPLVVIDTYEHAFYIDYENRKAEYVEKFMNHIDWSEVTKRFKG